MVEWYHTGLITRRRRFESFSRNSDAAPQGPRSSFSGSSCHPVELASCNLRKARTSESEFRRRLLAERLASSEVMPGDWWTILLPTLDRYEAG